MLHRVLHFDLQVTRYIRLERVLAQYRTLAFDPLAALLDGIFILSDGQHFHLFIRGPR